MGVKAHSLGSPHAVVFQQITKMLSNPCAPAFCDVVGHQAESIQPTTGSGIQGHMIANTSEACGDVHAWLKLHQQQHKTLHAGVSLCCKQGNLHHTACPAELELHWCAHDPNLQALSCSARSFASSLQTKQVCESMAFFKPAHTCWPYIKSSRKVKSFNAC